MEEAKERLDTGVVSVLQPEVGHDDAILETYLVSTLASSNGAMVASLGWVGPIPVRAASHACAVVPNLLVQEYPESRPDHRWTQELIDPAPRVVEDELAVPDLPGLGLRVVGEDVERIRME